MAARTRNGRVSFDAAVALLIHNQAALAAQHTAFLDQLGKDRQKMLEIEQRMNDLRTETCQIVARIEKRCDNIEAILIRHEAVLERLTEAIREKIGFKRH